jgi:hypothetical protein
VNPLRALAATGVAALVVFHACLLARRLMQPEAVDGVTALRWAGALAVLAAYLLATRAATSRLEPRQVLALGLTALSLHAPVLQGPAESARAAEFWTAVPTVVGAALGLAGLLGTTDSIPTPVTARTRRPSPIARRRPAIRIVPLLSPRPPPAPAHA